MPEHTQRQPQLTLEQVRLRNQRYQEIWAPTRPLYLEKARRPPARLLAAKPA